MKIMLIALIISIMFTFTAKGQNESFLDLTIEKNTLSDSEEIHSMSGGGSGGTSVGCGAGVRIVYGPKKSPLKITLEKLDKPEYLIGENITYEIVVENISAEPVVIPWFVGMERIIEAADKNYKPYIQVLFGFGVEESSYGFRSFVLDGLYGSEAVPGSLKVLQPGETARIRTTNNLSVSPKSFADGKIIEEFNVKAEFSIHNHPYSFPAAVQPAISENSIRIQVRKPEPQPESE